MNRKKGQRLIDRIDTVTEKGRKYTYFDLAALLGTSYATARNELAPLLRASKKYEVTGVRKTPRRGLNPILWERVR